MNSPVSWRWCSVVQQVEPESLWNSICCWPVLTQTLWRLIFNETICSLWFCLHCVFKLSEDVSDVLNTPGSFYQPGGSVGFSCFELSDHCDTSECCLTRCTYWNGLITVHHTGRPPHVQNFKSIGEIFMIAAAAWSKMRGQCVDTCKSTWVEMNKSHSIP